MARVSLKHKPTKSEVLGVPSPEEDFFPVSMNLSEPEISKLGLDSRAVGDTFDMALGVKVTSMSINEREGSDKRRHITLTVLEADKVAGDDKTAAETLFGKK